MQAVLCALLMGAALRTAQTAEYRPILRVSGTAVAGSVSSPVWGIEANTITLRMRLAEKVSGTGNPSLSNLLYTDGRWRIVTPSGTYAYRWSVNAGAGTAWAVWPCRWKTASDEARLDLARQADGTYKATFRVRAWGGVKWYWQQAFTLPGEAVRWE